MKDFDALQWLKDNQPTHGVCSYVIEFDKRIKELNNDICHARARANGLESKPLSLHSCLPNKCKNKEDAVLYFDYLLDPLRSPYRALFKGMVAHKDDKGYIGVSFNDLDISSTLLMSFLIASRLPFEYPQKTANFAALVKFGFDEAEAFYLSAITQRMNDTTLSLLPHNENHSILEISYGNKLRIHDIKAMKNGTPWLRSIDIDRYSDRKVGCQVFDIWLKGDMKHPFQLGIKMEDIKRKVYNGKFMYLARNQTKFPMELPAMPVGWGYEPEQHAKYGQIAYKTLMEHRKQWSPLA